MMACALKSEDYALALRSSGQNHTIIHIHNLTAQVLVGGAIWGRQGPSDRRNKLQPILLSIKVSLRKPFDSAAEIDKLDHTTVNYGTLSKQILKFLDSRKPNASHPESFTGYETDWALIDLVDMLSTYLTGKGLAGIAPSASVARGLVDGGIPCLEDRDDPAYRPPLLDPRHLMELGFTIHLPKATLLSAGVSLNASTAIVCMSDGQSTPFHSVLKIHDIRIPTLIGINANERLAKQIVVVNVEIDPYVCSTEDCYNELEQVIVKVSKIHHMQSHADGCKRVLKNPLSKHWSHSQLISIDASSNILFTHTIHFSTKQTHLS